MTCVCVLYHYIKSEQILVFPVSCECLYDIVLRRGDDTVEHPHRAQICHFELFEFLLLLNVDKQFSIEQFEPTESQSTAASPPVTMTFWVLPLTFSYLPNSAWAYLFPQSVSIHYFCSGLISVDPICPQPSHAY